MITNTETLHETETQELEQNTPLVFLGTKEVAACLGCSIPTAREIMHRWDFPLIVVGKALKVEQQAFRQWASVRRD